MLKKELPIPKEYIKDVEEIHGEMLDIFTNEISTIPGEFAYDSTRGAAEQIAMLRHMMIHYLLMRAFTLTSSDEYLDLIGDMNAVWRKKATKSTGRIIFYGKVGTVIPKGSVVSTEGSNSVNPINFVTLELGVIGDSGNVSVLAECVEEGSIGNVRPESIKVLVTEIFDITRVSNKEFKNGTDVESDDALRDRIRIAEQEEQLSGADVDYERWAKEVDGVGYAYCRETWNGPGTVKVLILDKNRRVASSELLNKVKQYIWPDLQPGQKNRGGKAPTGIKSFTVESPTIKQVSITGNFVITQGYDKSNVLGKIKKMLNVYFDKLDIEGTVKYNMVLSIIGTFLVNEDGLDDFSNIRVNGSTESIKLESQIANVSEVVAL